jgi:hypothetical protein
MHEQRQRRTSKLCLSALPVQFRNGACIRFSIATASASPPTRSSAAPSAPFNSRGSGKSCGAGSVAASSMQVSRNAAVSRAGLLSQSSAGAMLES